MKSSTKFSVARGFLLVAVSYALCAPASHAVPFTYDEAVSGDLPQLLVPQLPLPVFAFDIGTNTVSGTTAFSSVTTPFTADFDDFAFSIPANAQLTGISYAFSTISSGPPAAFVGYGLFEGNALPLGPDLGHEGIDLFGASPVTLFSDALPLAAGVYIFRGESLSGEFGESWLANYRIAFNVPSGSGPVTGVPEPQTLALLGLGLAGLVLTRRHA